MMGRQCSDQNKLFYSFNLDSHVPADHLLRGIDRVLDLSELHRHLAPYYSDTGRLSSANIRFWTPTCESKLYRGYPYRIPHAIRRYV